MADLWVQAWTPVYPAIDFSGRRAWFLARIAGFRQEGTTVLAAREDGVPVGLVTLSAAGWIDQVVVKREAQGTGVFDALMAAAKAQHPDGLGLDVNADNMRALSAYRRQGFRETGERFAANGARIVVLRWAGV